MRTPRSALPAALAAVLLSAGCVQGEEVNTSSGDTATPSRSRPTAGPTSGEPSSGRSGSGAPSSPGGGASATSTSPRTFRAKAGTDLSACADASCEVLVREFADIPLDPKFGCEVFTLTLKAPNRVSFVVIRSETNNVTGYIGGTGYLSLANGVTMTVREIEGTRAVLRFEPRAEDPENDRASGSEGLGLYGF